MKTGLVCVGVMLLASIVALAEKPVQNANPKLATVRKIFVEPIEGNSGTLARNRLMALIANSGRFEVVEDRKMADAMLKGLAETQDAGVAVTAQGEGGTGFIKGYLDAAGRKSSATRIINATLIIRLALPTGEIVWAWDDTKKCKRDSKSQCAVEDLLAQAK
jgi:hypothetical protein